MSHLKKCLFIVLIVFLSQPPSAFAKSIKVHTRHHRHHKKLSKILHKTKHHIPKASKGRKRKNELSAIGRGAHGSKVHY